MSVGDVGRVVFYLQLRPDCSPHRRAATTPVPAKPQLHSRRGRGLVKLNQTCLCACLLPCQRLRAFISSSQTPSLFVFHQTHIVPRLLLQSYPANSSSSTRPSHHTRHRARELLVAPNFSHNTNPIIANPAKTTTHTVTMSKRIAKVSPPPIPSSSPSPTQSRLTPPRNSPTAPPPPSPT